MTTPLIEMRHIEKSYGSIRALRGVNFHVDTAETVGLIGDNGAGKSTLIKILTGFVRADHGQIILNGKEIQFASPREARENGIETVYQEQALADDLSVARNLFMGKEPIKSYGPFKLLDIETMRSESRKMLAELRLNVDIDKETRYCSGGERQGISIARAIYFNASVVILDEPTNALGVAAVQRVLDLIRELKQRGIAVIFISHNLYHVHLVSDRIVTLVRGTKIKDAPKNEVSVEELNDILMLRSGIEQVSTE
ncbi:MAG: ABC transporter ATP-binding protein [Chloroflexota bacterium]|nr:MAG: ABC transporter ATP-binding protein [Chloroflexota bacterium]